MHGESIEEVNEYKYESLNYGENNMSYNAFKKYEVKAENLEDFLEKYTKRGRHKERGEEYVEARIKSHSEDLSKYGYTFITHHDSITGETVSYYGNNKEE